MPFGFEIDVEVTNIVPLPTNKHFPWSGNMITQRVKIKKAEVTAAAANQAPVTKEIYDHLRDLQIKDEWPSGSGYSSELPEGEDDETDPDG
jgi:hypothetical protein